jgi:hypothetical protein
VFQLDDTDIHLLYKSLVVLPQDKHDETPTVEETSKAKSAESDSLSQKLVGKEIETPVSTSQVEETNTPISIAQEPNGTYKVESQPFVLFTSEVNKNKYLAEGSNFTKAIGALKIAQLAKYITSDHAVLDTLVSYECIWCMGIDLNTEKQILALKHKNILISPDIENLATVEEKKRMFSALKEFAILNMGLFTKI